MFQARPTTEAAMAPMIPRTPSRLLASARRMRPTVAVMATQPRICGRRLKAILKPSPMVASSPSSRLRATPTSAALQKMIRKYSM